MAGHLKEIKDKGKGERKGEKRGSCESCWSSIHPSCDLSIVMLDTGVKQRGGNGRGERGAEEKGGKGIAARDGEEIKRGREKTKERIKREELREAT